MGANLLTNTVANKLSCERQEAKSNYVSIQFNQVFTLFIPNVSTDKRKFVLLLVTVMIAKCFFPGVHTGYV